jgi:hypothetical protein
MGWLPELTPWSNQNNGIMWRETNDHENHILTASVCRTEDETPKQQRWIVCCTETVRPFVVLNILIAIYMLWFRRCVSYTCTSPCIIPTPCSRYSAAQWGRSRASANCKVMPAAAYLLLGPLMSDRFTASLEIDKCSDASDGGWAWGFDTAPVKRN